MGKLSPAARTEAVRRIKEIRDELETLHESIVKTGDSEAVARQQSLLDELEKIMRAIS